MHHNFFCISVQLCHNCVTRETGPLDGRQWSGLANEPGHDTKRRLDYVIVYMMSRAFRNAHDELVTRMMLRKLGVTLVSAKENFGTGYLATPCRP